MCLLLSRRAYLAREALSQSFCRRVPMCIAVGPERHRADRREQRCYVWAVAHTTRTINPATEDPLEEFEFDSSQRIESALAASHAAFRGWRQTSQQARADVLRAAASLLEREQAQHARHITVEMGKPTQQARAEVAKCARACEYFAEHGPRLLVRTRRTAACCL